MQRTQMPLKAHDRLRLILAAVGLAIALLVVMWASFVFVPKKYLDLIFSNPKWGRFTVVSVLFIIYCLKTYWRARKHLLFWAVFIGVLAVHFLGVGYFFYKGAGLPLLTFGPTVALEWALLALAVYYVLGIGPSIQRL